MLQNIAGVIQSLDEHYWLKWSLDHFGTHDLLSWLWRLQWLSWGCICCSWLHHLELLRQAQYKDGNSGTDLTEKEPSAIELPRRVHSTTTRLHCQYIGISELR